MGAGPEYLMAILTSRHGQADGTQIGPERQRLMVFQTFYIHIHDHLAKHSSNLTALIYFILYIKFGSL